MNFSASLCSLLSSAAGCGSYSPDLHFGAHCEPEYILGHRSNVKRHLQW